jgi:hypothetical protein
MNTHTAIIVGDDSGHAERARSGDSAEMAERLAADYPTCIVRVYDETDGDRYLYSVQYQPGHVPPIRSWNEES